MKIKVTKLMMTTSAASAITPRYPEKMASSSKAHHSKQSIIAPGMPIRRYLPQSLNASLVNGYHVSGQALKIVM
jgi:hypothetical protein